jgi:hypothetical protein
MWSSNGPFLCWFWPEEESGGVAESLVGREGRAPLDVRLGFANGDREGGSRLGMELGVWHFGVEKEKEEAEEAEEPGAARETAWIEVRGCPLCDDVDVFWVRFRGLIDCIDFECMISDLLLYEKILSHKYQNLLLVNLVSCGELRSSE